jgi:tetratricopeptide (TPR) repeat protein
VKAPAARLRVALVLALCSCACSDSGSAHATGALGPGTQRLSAAPFPGELQEVDPAAVELLRRSAAEVDAHSEEAEPWSRLGAAYHAHRLFALARVCYEQRLLRAADDARTWYLAALVEEELGEPARAEACLEESLRIDAGYPPTHWRLGLSRLARGELAGAEAAMRAALQRAPQDAASVVGLARVLLQARRETEAVVLLEQHLARLPSDDNARFLLGTALCRIGRTEEGARALAGSAGAEPVQSDPWRAEVLSLRQGYRAEFLQALDHLGAGRVERAVAMLEELHRRAPEDTLVHVNLHRAYRLQGDLQRAIDLLLEAREIDPLEEIVHLHLAGAYRELARQGAVLDDAVLAQALASSQRACELSPTYADAHGLRGDVLADLRRPDESTEAYAQAAALDRTSAMWQEKAGLGLCRVGRWADAVAPLRRLDLLQPDSPRTLFYLSAALANSGQVAEALDPIERARRLAPQDAVIEKAWGDIQRSLEGLQGLERSGSSADEGGE